MDVVMLRDAIEAYGTEVRWVPGLLQLGDGMTKDEGAVMDSFKAAMTGRCYNIGDEARALTLRAEAKVARLARGVARKKVNETRKVKKSTEDYPEQPSGDC